MRHSRRTFLRKAVLTGGAVALKGVTAKAEQRAGSRPSAEILSADEFRRAFQSPGKKYRPIARWWWPGNLVADEELRREIDVLDKAGFGGAEIQAFIKGLNRDVFSDEQWRQMNSYASESFFRHVAAAIEEARSRGMFIDYTFGSGWPFGGGEAITPELASVELRSTHLSVSGPVKFDGKIHVPSVTDGDPLYGADILKGLPAGWPERLKERTKVVAVVAVRGECAEWRFHGNGARGDAVVKPGELERGAWVDLTSRLSPDGVLNWEVPPGTWQLFVFASVPTVQRVNGAGDQGPQLVMDHLSSAAFAAHAQRVGDNAIPYIGRYFDDGLRAIFCDSLEVAANLYWSDDFLAEFRRRRGYDLLPYLPILKLQTDSEPFGEHIDLPVFDMAGIGDQVRRDYRQTVSDLMVERFYCQFNQWAHSHNLLSRTQAHGAPADVLRIYGEADIPETEMLYDAGGYDFLKMAASAANVYGRSIVGSESFVWPGAAYQTTPEKMKLAADEALTAGVNAIVYHGFPYIVPEIPAPGWHPFTGFGEGNYSSQFNELNPLWPHLAQLNGYITRVQYVSQTGKNIAAIALYRNDLIHGAEELPPAPRLNQALLDAGYNYDHINADALTKCTVRGRMLATAGGSRYRALVLPAAQSLNPAVSQQLDKFAAAGLPIVFAGAIPQQSDGFSENGEGNRLVAGAISAVRRFSNVYGAADPEAVVANLRRIVQPDVKFHGRALSFIRWKAGKLDAYFLRNESDAARLLDAEFDAQGTPELWDPWTGKIAAAPEFARNGAWVRVKLTVPPFGSVLIVFDPAGARLPAAKLLPERAARTEQIAGSWQFTAAGLVQSGKSAVLRRDLPELIDWSLDSELRGFSGRGVYKTNFTVSPADAGSRKVLDLGIVRDVAEVTVNGRPVATLLLRPYRVEITDFVRPGENMLEVAVTNTLFNSMALRQPRPFRPGATENPSGLMSAGLIGPVQIEIA
jgi:hypothetical protein